MIPLVVYVASWSGWFATSTGYYRDYARAHGVHTPVISALYSLFEYHREAIGFGVDLRNSHPYQSQPWDWLLVTRPVAFYYACYTGAAGTHPCPRRAAHKGRRGRRRCWRWASRRSGGGRCWPCCSAWAGGCSPGLAGRGGAARRDRGLAPVVPAGDQDPPVLLLRAGVRAVPDLVHRALPGPDHRTRPGERAAPGDRRRYRRRVRACVLLMFWYFYPILAGRSSRTGMGCPHVVPGLDLASGCRKLRHPTRPADIHGSSHRNGLGQVLHDPSLVALRHLAWLRPTVTPKRLTIVPDTATRSAPGSGTRPSPWPPPGSPGTCDWPARLPVQPERRVLVGDEGERIGGHPAGPAEDSLHEAEHARG